MPRRGLSPAALEQVRTSVAPDARIVRVRPMGGGISCIVHAVRLATTDGGRHGVVVRRYGAYAQEHDVGSWEREYLLLRELSDSGQPVPRPLALHGTDSCFGAPTILMELVAGRPDLAPRNVREHLRQLAETLFAFHRLPVERFGFLPDQERWVEQRLRPERAPHEDPLRQAVWAAAQQVRPRGHTGRRALVHADYWPGNVLSRRGRLVSVVDWEISCIGDPTQDVATCRGDVSVLFCIEAANWFRDAYVAAGGNVDTLAFWDLVNLDTALAEMTEWAAAYPRLGRRDVTPALAVERIRIFAEAILDATMGA